MRLTIQFPNNHLCLPCSFTAHAAPTGSPPAMDALHFFGVFDGHGGAEAALHCARTLHERIAEVRAADRIPVAPLTML